MKAQNAGSYWVILIWELVQFWESRPLVFRGGVFLEFLLALIVLGLEFSMENCGDS